MARILAGLASQVLDTQSKLISPCHDSVLRKKEAGKFLLISYVSPEHSGVSFVDSVLLGSPEVERKFGKSRIAERCPTPQFAASLDQ
jgi:hypothetical protein